MTSPSHPDSLRPVADLALCRQCDWVMVLPPRAAGEAARCPRCHHHVAPAAQADMQQPLAWALAALMMLGLVFAFDFLSFSIHGIGHTMSFVAAAGSLLDYDYPALALLLLTTTVALPGFYLAALIYLCLAAQARRNLPGAIGLARALRPMEPWMMADVFIVGVLVSLIKIVTLADIHIGASFVAFCLYSLLLLRTLDMVDWIWLWNRIALMPASATTVRHGRTGHSQRLIPCNACGMPFRDTARHRCPRCGKRHRTHAVDRLQLTWALLITACILYVPANIYPIMLTTSLGHTEPQTIVGGVLHLAETGSWPIAAVIFLASIVVPISKIAALGWLCLATRRQDVERSRRQMRLYRLSEKIGRWSMIDVFVVAVLGALVHAGTLLAIQPGPAALSFAAVVVVTMVAALTFDTRPLWREAAPVSH